MKVIEMLDLYRNKGYCFSVNQHGCNTMLVKHNQMNDKGQSILITIIDKEGHTVEVESIKDILKRDINETYISTNYAQNNIQYLKPNEKQFRDMIENNCYSSFKDIMRNL